MRMRVTLIVLGAVGTILYSVATLPGQTAPSGYRAPRTSDGKPKLEGIWQAMNTANWNIEAHEAAPPAIPELGAVGAVPAGLGIVVDGPIPYKPEALAKKKANGANWVKLDPEVKCYLPGVPRAMYQPFAFQIVQSPKHIMFAYEFADAVRTVYMADQTEAPADSWMGWSNGKWEGETLVIDTTGFNGKAWFDRAGNFASDQLHVVERISARSADTLNYEATMEDPNVFSRPWKIKMPLYRRRETNMQLMEYKCVPFAEELMYGHLRKKP